MPLYEYECAACGERFEVIRKFSDAPLTACTRCGKGPVEKLLSSPAIQFKGEGWYVTDYARKGKGDEGKKESGDKAAGDGEKTSGESKGASDGAAKPAEKASDSKKAGSTGKAAKAKSD